MTPANMVRLSANMVRLSSLLSIDDLNHRPHLTVLVWDVKERVGDDVPGVMVYHLF